LLRGEWAISPKPRWFVDNKTAANRVSERRDGGVAAASKNSG
jgi:hypothetical protein